PADMVDVEVGAQNGVDRIAREARRRKVGEEWPLQIVPGRDAAVRFVVAKTGVDNDTAAGRFDDERVDAHLQPTPLVGKMRLQPADWQNLVVGRLRQDEAAPP